MDNIKEKKISEDYKSKTFINEIDLDMITVFHLSDVKDLIHALTLELKQRGVAEPFIILPFRPHNDDKKVSFFLQKILQNLHDNEILNKHISRAEPFVLFNALKFLWCRLPGSFVVGWRVYERFKSLEKRAGYPKHAFAELFPLCFDDLNHASITYDFIDLMAKLSANTASNMLYGKTIARVFSLFAFPKLHENSIYNNNHENNSFSKGLTIWISGVNATFHLLQAFIRSMLPKENDIKQKFGMQLSLQNLLTNYRYPPNDSIINNNSILNSVPLITVYSNTRSENPAELLAKTIDLILFEKPEEFTGTEIYLLLKYLFTDDSISDQNGEQNFHKASYEKTFSKLSPLSQRIIQLLSCEKNYYLLKYGWYKTETFRNDRISSFDSIKISNVPIDDSYIWTWMSSLSPEVADAERSLFGRSIIIEFNFPNCVTKDTQNNNQCIIIQEINTYNDQKHSTSTLEVTPEILPEYSNMARSPSNTEFPAKNSASIIYSSKSSAIIPNSRQTNRVDPRIISALDFPGRINREVYQTLNLQPSKQNKIIISSPLSNIPTHLQDEFAKSDKESEQSLQLESDLNEKNTVNGQSNYNSQLSYAHFTFVNLEDDDDEMYPDEHKSTIDSDVFSTSLENVKNSNPNEKNLEVRTKNMLESFSNPAAVKPRKTRTSFSSAAYNGPLSPPPPNR